jgi:hypothetical protein
MSPVNLQYGPPPGRKVAPPFSPNTPAKTAIIQPIERGLIANYNLLAEGFVNRMWRFYVIVTA